ncbi:MAG: serine hydrolase domain-containing protein [Pseudomonadota bacterium]|nr:serine hydrolase domain-containing protein [Pseudomonadota bacterium]
MSSLAYSLLLRRLILRLVGACLIVSLFSSAAADESFRARTFNYDFTDYVEWLDSLLRENEIPGAALAIVSREGIMHLQTWGVREVDQRAPVTTDSIFRIASMSKTFAGAAATLLVEQNLQNWETRISDLFPDLRLGNGVSYRSITLKQVASHSTGLMPHSYSNLLDDGIGYERIKNRFADIPAVCKPGRCYGYQNVIFSLIGDVVEESTGSSYGQYLEEQIFRPLGMVSASVGLDPYQNDPNATVPHTKRQGQWRPVATNPAYYTTAPAAGINASVFDMTMWLRANLGAFPELLGESVLNQLHTPVIETPYGNYFNRWESLENAYYGIGWRIFDLSGLRVVHHGGGVRGYRSEMAFSDEANIGLVLLINAESSAINDVIPTFYEHLTNTL